VDPQDPIAPTPQGMRAADSRFVAAPIAYLAGDDAPLPRGGPLALVEGVLTHPANVMHEHRHRPRTAAKLALIVAISMAATGLCLAAFGGGAQLLVVPLKLALGMALCALICLPSLHIFSALSGGRVSIRDTSGALLVGLALTSVLLVGFVPIAWLFSQATDSAPVVGALHLVFFLVSAFFGLRLTRRAIVASTGRRVPVLALWSVLFVLVVVQMSTTLRPLVGPFAGLALAPRAFFLVHWLS